MKVYVAGFFDDRQRLRLEADKLVRMGHEITSSWLKEMPAPTIGLADWELSLAVRDLNEIQSSDLLIVDTLSVTPRGGREVEYGFAIGVHIEDCYIVGPVRNIFHRLANKHFANWDECINYMEAKCHT